MEMPPVGYNKKSLFLFNFVLTVIAYGLFVFNFHFSLDDYCVLYQQKDVAISIISESYRNCLGIIFLLLDFIGLNVTKHQIFFGVILILAIAVSVTRITHEILKYIDGKALLVNLGTICFFLNVFVSEWFYFAEAYLHWALSIIGITYASVYLVKSDHLKKNWLIGTLLLFVAAGSYQVSLSIYVYIVMGIIFFQYKGTICKESFMSVVRAAASAVVAVLSNICMTKFLVRIGFAFDQPRLTSDIHSFLPVLQQMIPFQKELWIRGKGVLPNGVMAGALLFLLVLLAECLIQKRIGIVSIIYMGIVVLSGQMVMYLAIAAQGFFWVTLRIAVPVFGIYTVLIWFIAYYSDRDFIRGIAQAVIILFLCFNFCGIQRMAVELLITNALDRYSVGQIGNYIHQYEESSKAVIQKVGFYKDQNPCDKYYEFMKTEYFEDFAIKAFTQEWSDLNALNYYTGRNYVRAEVPDDIKERISSKDWSGLVLEEQLIFEGDTLYIAVY